MDSNRIIRVKEVAALTGLAPSTIQAKQNPCSTAYDPHFPPPVRLGKRALGFQKSEILEWIERQRGAVSS